MGWRVIKKKKNSAVTLKLPLNPTGARFFFFLTLVTGPRRSSGLKLSGTRVYKTGAFRPPHPSGFQLVVKLYVSEYILPIETATSGLAIKAFWRALFTGVASGFGFRASGFGFRASGFGLRLPCSKCVMQRTHHARVLEGVAKSHFPLKAVVFQ